MLLAAMIFTLFGVLAAVYLWLCSVASHAVLRDRYPEWTHRVYRPKHQVIQRRGGPVRLLVLISTPSPNSSDPLIFQMRILALGSLFCCIFAMTLWVLS